MKALVVYESMYGNTEQIARAIAEGLSSHIPVEAFEVGDAPTTIGPDVALLVVGGPTHMFGLSRPGSRESAAERGNGHVISSRIGLREWFETLESQNLDIPAAAFDTTIHKPRFVRYFGTASGKASGRLKRRGFKLAASPERFWVVDAAGPLVDGEIERARTWGMRLGAELGVAPVVD